MKYKEPVRKIKTNRRSSRGYYAFRGVDCIAHESTAERDFVMRMEFDADVSTVVSQPVQLTYADALGVERRYTPDYLVYFKTPNRKPMLVEVKERVELVEKFDKLRFKFASAFAAAKENGWIFKIYDERRIRGLFLENIRKLRNYSANSVSDDDRNDLVHAISLLAPIPVKKFLEHYTASRQEYLSNISRIWWLAINHHIELDLSDPLSEATLIVGAKKTDD